MSVASLLSGKPLTAYRYVLVRTFREPLLDQLDRWSLIGSQLIIYPGRRNANQQVTFFTCHQTAELASYFSAEQTSNLDRRVIRYAHQ
jgi:hypothetical protein